MNVYLLCLNCQKITEGEGSEMGSVTVDQVKCKICHKDFKCASAFTDGGTFKDIFGKDKKYCIPFDIANSFHR
ncbi:MAG: hypothetical protein IKO39_11525 [Treponema sp.]|nr:hypothetical protein [Treponema sp.]MBR4600662.1 hypothetical protein [Treponema sp.]